MSEADRPRERHYWEVVVDGGLNLRAAPTVKGKRVAGLVEHELVLALGGVAEADGYLWVRVRTQRGVDGWAAQRASDQMRIASAIDFVRVPPSPARDPLAEIRAMVGELADDGSLTGGQLRALLTPIVRGLGGVG